MKSDYKVKVTDNMILIIDLNLGNMSVTNDMDNVLADISSKGFDINSEFIIARDSEGNYDRVVINDNIFKGWEPIQAKDVIERTFITE